jgi:hypothetical protein
MISLGQLNLQVPDIPYTRSISRWRSHLLKGLVQTALSAPLQTFGEYQL